jgi:CBS domain-containing protein
MRDDFPYVEEDASLSKVIRKLKESQEESPDNNCVLVYSKKKKFLGIISMWNIIQAMGPCLLKEAKLGEQEADWDLAFHRACRTCSHVGIEELIQKDVPVVKPSDPLARIMEIFLDYRRGRAVVEEGGKVIGLILLSDLYKEIARDVEKW